MKSFGDFIIARWSLRRLAASASCCLLFGDHLRELDQTLGTFSGGYAINHGEAIVPSMFDTRKAGLIRSVASAVRVRRAFDQLVLPGDTRLVFDNVGMRERFIAGRYPACALPPAQNIYAAYCKLFDAPLAQATAIPVVGRHARTTVGIFPGSRMAAKTLKADTVATLCDILRASAVEVRIFRLEGEPSDLTSDARDVTVVPRSFSAMADAVRSVDGVVSADSMPAHMAEYFDLPVYVISPVPNAYWLPLSCLVADRWSLAEETDAQRRGLDAFLNTPATHSATLSSFAPNGHASGR